MKLNEVVRPSDRAAERAKEVKKEEAIRKRVVSAYVRALTAPQFKPHATDVEQWLFGGGTDSTALKDLEIWTDAIGAMVDVQPNDKSVFDYEKQFRIFSHHLDIPHDLVDQVCDHYKRTKE